MENKLEEKDLLRDIIENDRVTAQYQPIISLVKRKIIGFEGLSRGINKSDSKLVPPTVMFEYAYKKGLAVTFDRLCREKCLQGFKDYHHYEDDVYLFINIEASIIEKVEGSNYLLNQVLRNDISPNNIVIEINESNVQSMEHLKRFTDNYRKEGFLIAIDDVGAGFSNFERISLLKPDIIKLDKSLVKDIEKNYHKQEIFKSLVSLANRIGAVVVAEGVETQGELYYAAEFGAHMIQGYYFSKPEFLNRDIMRILEKKVSDTAIEYKNYMNEKKKKEQKHRSIIDAIIDDFIADLEIESFNRLNNLLSKFVSSNSELNIECAYILNDNGIQVSNTVFADKVDNNYRQGLMFYPAEKGSDNSLKNYFYELMNSSDGKYSSYPYISHATGNICITVSRIFKHNGNKKYVLCVDFTHRFN